MHVLFVLSKTPAGYFLEDMASRLLPGPAQREVGIINSGGNRHSGDAGATLVNSTARNFPNKKCKRSIEARTINIPGLKQGRKRRDNARIKKWGQSVASFTKRLESTKTQLKSIILGGGDTWDENQEASEANMRELIALRMSTWRE